MRTAAAPTGSATARDTAQGRPLTPFELLMLLDERPGYPMCFYVETMLSGSLDTERLRSALAAATLRHPSLRSRAVQQPDGWRWEPTVGPPELVLAARGTARHRAVFRPFNIRREPGLRAILFEEGPDQSSLVLQIHHSACDGIAALEFLGDLWSIYHGSEPPPFRPGLNRERTRGLVPGSAVPRAANQAAASWTFASFLPATLASDGHRPTRAADDRPYKTVRLSVAETAALRTAAGAAGVSLNDLTVAATLRAICRWNRRQGRPATALRINMPVSLRPPGCREPAGNRIGYAFLDRTAAACRDANTLARSLAEASRWIQSTGAAGLFLDVLRPIAGMPWLLRLLTRLPLSLSSAVVSNVGNVRPRMRARVPFSAGHDRPADLAISHVVGVPPVRPGTSLAVGVTRYAGQLAITAMTDPMVFGKTATASVASLIADELRQFAGQPATPCSTATAACSD